MDAFWSDLILLFEKLYQKLIKMKLEKSNILILILLFVELHQNSSDLMKIVDQVRNQIGLEYSSKCCYKLILTNLKNNIYFERKFILNLDF